MLPSRQLRILVVEDDRTDREVYKQCLRDVEDPKFEFAEAGSAADGIELARTFRPDCILLDYDLPDGTGLDVLAHFNHEGHPGAVVMLTAFGGEGLAVQAMKAGVTDYLPKRQVSSESLGAVVTKAVEKFEMKRRLEQHREALERSERRYATLLEAMPQMVWTADPQGAVQYANLRWLQYTGLTIENAGRLGWDAVLHPDDRQSTQEAWALACQSKSVFEVEHRLRRAADQSYRWHLVRAVPLKNRAGEVIEWLGTCTEIEEQKQAEKAVLEKEKLEGLGMLAGGIAHDFNNLLVAILGGASLVRDTLPPDDTSRPILEDVIRAGERAADLTRKMLAYSGRANFFVEPIDVDQLVQETCRFLRPSIPRNIQIKFEGSKGLPRVATDSEQLRHLIVEVVTNAVEAIGEKGQGTIWVRCHLAKVDAEFAREGKLEVAVGRGVPFVGIEVQDTGCGMDESIQSKVFDPFFSTKFTGRGMGLSAVKGFVRSNGGAVRVRSSPGRGSVFQIVLPATAERRRQRAGGGER
jgi:PAS domain S-box-containing protein